MAKKVKKIEKKAASLIKRKSKALAKIVKPVKKPGVEKATKTTVAKVKLVGVLAKPKKASSSLKFVNPGPSISMKKPHKIDKASKGAKELEKSSSKTTLKVTEKGMEKSQLIPETPKAPMRLGILQKRKAEEAPVKAPKVKGSKKVAATQELDSEISLHGQTAKWLQFYKKYGNIEAVNYDMTRQFEEKKPIQHPKLGWGFIIAIVNDRLEVLFQEGIKTLISNYNPDLKL